MSARASAVDDLRYLKQAQNIASWETGRRIMIYPPPQISSVSIQISEKQMTPELFKGSSTSNLPASPSQIPDSQPPRFFRTNAADLLDMNTHSPSPSSIVSAVPPPTQDSPEKSSPVVYQSAIRPPRAVSLEPVNLSLTNTPAPTDGSISPDRLPHRLPLFTSTPKSKPLKHMLNDTVQSESSLLISRKSLKSPILGQQQTAITFLLSLPILQHYFLCLSSVVSHSPAS